MHLSSISTHLNARKVTTIESSKAESVSCWTRQCNWGFRVSLIASVHHNAKQCKANNEIISLGKRNDIRSRTKILDYKTSFHLLKQVTWQSHRQGHYYWVSTNIYFLVHEIASSELSRRVMLFNMLYTHSTAIYILNQHQLPLTVIKHCVLPIAETMFWLTDRIDAISDFPDWLFQGMASSILVASSAL